MRVGRRSKLVLHATMWAMVGIALLAIPALISTYAHIPAAADNSASGNSTGSTNILISNPKTSATGLTKVTLASAPESWTLGDFLVRLALVLALAISLSSLAMFRLRRRFKRSID